MPSRAAIRAPRPAATAGFSLVEVIVVMVIVAILLAIAIPQFTSSRTASRLKLVAEAAVQYDSAITSFRLEHGNRAPELGTADWPTAVEGPVNMQAKPYLRGGAPEAITRGDSGIGGSVDVGGAEHAALVYERVSDTEYRLTVHRKDGTSWTPYCQVGNAAPTVPAC